MDKITATKKIVSGIVGFSVGSVIGAALRNNVTATNTLEKVEVVVAAYAVGSMAAAASRDWSDREIDKIIAWFSNDKIIKS